MSSSKSDEIPPPKAGARAKLPLAVAPWLALAAMAALWPRGKKKGDVAETPRIITPDDLDKLEPGRGRCAQTPFQIPPLGWKDILWRTYREMGRDRLSALAGGVTFSILLATFPGIAAFVSLYGLFSDVASVERQLSHMSAILPGEAVKLIGGQMLRLATQRQATLSVAFIAATAVSIWSANAAVKSLVDGLNIIYDEPEKRDYFRRSLFTYVATLAALLFMVAVMAVLVAAPVFFHDIGLHKFGVWWGPMRWMAVLLVAAGGLTLLYRYGPSRKHARWRWVSFGGVLAALVWLGVSLTFSWYINHFTHFSVTYGSLAAPFVFMFWVWVSVMIVFIGGELNSEIEHQTAIDTTIGEAKPLGERGAVMADSVGKAFTVSPREAVGIGGAFLGRQVGYVRNFVRRVARV